jgi:hypothetical protein
MKLQGAHLAKTGCAIPCFAMFSMLELVKIGCVFGKLDVYKTLYPLLANVLGLISCHFYTIMYTMDWHLDMCT